MSEYYDEDEDKITFDEAEWLVDRFLRRHAHRVSRVTSKDVADKLDVSATRHNLIRINKALDKELPVERPSGARATQFRIDE